MKFWNKIKIFTYLFIGFIYIQNISSANAAKIPSSIVFDAITGDIIHSDNPDKIQYPASLTKLMTLYLTFNAIEQKKNKFRYTINRFIQSFTTRSFTY